MRTYVKQWNIIGVCIKMEIWAAQSRFLTGCCYIAAGYIPGEILLWKVDLFYLGFYLRCLLINSGPVIWEQMINFFVTGEPVRRPLFIGVTVTVASPASI